MKRKKSSARPLKRDFTDTWTRSETLDVLEGALAQPARRMDVPLIKECLGTLAPRYEEAAALRAPAVWAGIRQAIQPEGRATYRKRSLSLVLAAMLVLAMAAAAIATAVDRGVFNFIWDFGFDRSDGTVQPAAAQLLHKDLASASFGNVEVNVREAVYDGRELRVVYSVWDKDFTGEFTEEDLYKPVIDGGWEEGLTCCDFIKVNGQDAYFDDTFQAYGDKPGEMLYYLQTRLDDWGIVIEGDTLTVELPMKRGENGLGSRIAEELTFSIPADIPEGTIRQAKQAKTEIDGIKLEMRKAEFSPVAGTIDIAIIGDQMEMEKWAYLWGDAQLYDADGNLLGITSVGHWGFVEDETTTIHYKVSPPEVWPDSMRLSLPKEDGSFDSERWIPVELEGV